VAATRDSTADLPDVKRGNAAFETAVRLVPMLRERGYRFVGLDEVIAH
jgi:hypothetical protein